MSIKPMTTPYMGDAVSCAAGAATFVLATVALNVLSGMPMPPACAAVAAVIAAVQIAFAALSLRRHRRVLATLAGDGSQSGAPSPKQLQVLDTMGLRIVSGLLNLRSREMSKAIWDNVREGVVEDAVRDSLSGEADLRMIICKQIMISAMPTGCP